MANSPRYKIVTVGNRTKPKGRKRRSNRGGSRLWRKLKVALESLTEIRWAEFLPDNPFQPALENWSEKIKGLLRRKDLPSPKEEKREQSVPHFLYLRGCGKRDGDRQLLKEYILSSKSLERNWEFVGVDGDGTLIYLDPGSILQTSDDTTVVWVKNIPIDGGPTFVKMQQFLRDMGRDRDGFEYMQQLIELERSGAMFRHLNLLLYNGGGLILYSINFQYPDWIAVPSEGGAARIQEAVTAHLSTPLTVPGHKAPQIVERS